MELLLQGYLQRHAKKTVGWTWKMESLRFFKPCWVVNGHCYLECFSFLDFKIPSFLYLNAPASPKFRSWAYMVLEVFGSGLLLIAGKCSVELDMPRIS